MRRILASGTLRAHVRELRGVNLLRLPVWRGEGAALAIDLLPAHAVCPMVLVIGNQPGVGKSLLVRMILAVVFGRIAEGECNGLSVKVLS